MKKKRCFIVGAGSFDGMAIPPGNDDLIIAADGGYTYLKKLGIEPQVLMGDFDSLELVPEHEHLLRHSPIKDDTDMALAVAYAAEQGCSQFFLYGGLGGRIDHTIANLQLLNGMSHAGLEAYLIGNGSIITAVTAERITFSSDAQGMVSVFCLGEAAKGVWERGLKYQLTDAVMTCDRTLGVSNEFTGVQSWIEVHEGTLQIVWDVSNGLPDKRIPLNLTAGNITSAEGLSAEGLSAEVFSAEGRKVEGSSMEECSVEGCSAEGRKREARSIVSDSGWNAMHENMDAQMESETYVIQEKDGVQE